MQHQPAYHVAPATRTIPARSARRQVRFFLLCVLNALVLIGADPLGIASLHQPHAPFRVVERLVAPSIPAGWIISIGLLALCIACLATVGLDSFALFLPAPRLQRWRTSSYTVIGVLISLITLTCLLSIFAAPDPCTHPGRIPLTDPPTVCAVIGG